MLEIHVPRVRLYSSADCKLPQVEWTPHPTKDCTSEQKETMAHYIGLLQEHKEKPKLNYTSRGRLPQRPNPPTCTGTSACCSRRNLLYARQLSLRS